MKENKLGNSIALGFWAKHVESVDALYEAYVESSIFEEAIRNLPPSLSKLCSDEKIRDQLINIFDAAEKDCDPLLESTISRVQSVFSGNLRLKFESKRIVDWSKSLNVRLKRDRSDNRIVIGCSIWTAATLGMTMYLTMWTKGGKAAAERNANIILDCCGSKPLKGSEDKNELDWDNGVIILSRVALADFIREKSEFEVDLDEASSGLIKQLHDKLPIALVHILEAQ